MAEVSEATQAAPGARLARIVASGAGTGYAPVAPGTFGSLLGVAIGSAVLATGPAWLPLAIAGVILAGLWAIRAVRASDDPGWVVIDEVAGQMVALLPLSRPAPLGIAAAFLLFRMLDIAKPGPVGWFDRRQDSLGVMGDDVVAGGLAAIILWIGVRMLQLIPS